ncbi:hypothetical protein [Algisphaera agarilytica]|uniref:Glycosyltransferase n=1 Tax=Algisphaera agarilytica TaxID=1385975 RepID=A0A7X0H7I9_9BACT|nr:hypothetical protein [Algisphaera agarilytica]MBB6430543.1 hypothetical protein [Algisphaera agarilytica]
MPLPADSPLLPLPDIDLRHLQRLTDDTGIYQHAVFATPDANHGYCIDDNARALIAGLLYADLHGLDESATPLHTYLNFIAYAYNADTKQFRNFMAFDRSWLEDSGSHDSQGRNIWAMGLTAKLGPTESIRGLGRDLFAKALPALDGLNFIRSWAFSLLGIDAYLDAVPDDAGCAATFEQYAVKLFDAYTAHAEDDWPWWEDEATYDNAKLPHALLIAGKRLQREDMTAAGLTSLRWLLDQQLATGDDGTPHLSIIGNQGWLQRGKPRAPFDQQPLEAYALVDACLTAARATQSTPKPRAAEPLPGGDKAPDPTFTTPTHWEASARLCYDWFTGKNDLGILMLDPETGGGKDGLNADGPNQNQGAESSLAPLLATLEMHRYAAEASL